LRTQGFAGDAGSALGWENEPSRLENSPEPQTRWFNGDGERAFAKSPAVTSLTQKHGREAADGVRAVFAQFLAAARGILHYNANVTRCAAND
jgi:hypothetical protein